MQFKIHAGRVRGRQLNFIEFFQVLRKGFREELRSRAVEIVLQLHSVGVTCYRREIMNFGFLIADFGFKNRRGTESSEVGGFIVRLR